MHDVVVVGAGPAGLTVANTLADRGYDVAVLEEHEHIGFPVHCTGLLGMEAFEELDLPRSTILSTIRSARFHTSTGLGFTVRDQRLEAAVVDRAAFDRALAERAQRAGAVIRLGARVQRLERASDHVRAELPQKQAVKARAAVLACGAHYRLNRMLDLGMPPHFSRSAQTETALRHDDSIDLYVGRQLAPGGFGWIVPFRRGETSFARIGLMCDDAPGRFESFAERLGVPQERRSVRLKMVPLAPVKRVVADRVLAVGDAAGFVKPTTGGGIYYGLLSGRIAGDVLDEALRRDQLTAPGLRDYENRCRQRFSPEIRAGLAFRHIVARLDDAAIDALMHVVHSEGVVPMLLKHARFNWHRGAALALLRHGSLRRVALSAIFS
jgi:geranylgeranyl reductase family protein